MNFNYLTKAAALAHMADAKKHGFKPEMHRTVNGWRVSFIEDEMYDFDKDMEADEVAE